MTPDNPQGTGDEDFASIDAAMDSFSDDDEQDQPQADNQAQPSGDQDDPPAEQKPEDGDDGDDELPEIDGQADGEDTPGPDDYTGGQFAAHTAKVKRPDGSLTTVAELLNGSMMLGDYRTKTADVAREREAIQAESGRLQSLTAELQQQRETVAVLAELLKPREPDPALLDQGDFATYALQERAYNDQNRKLNQLMADHQAHQERQKADTAARMTERRAKERQALAARMPGLFSADGRPTEKYGRFWQAVVSAGEHYGYTAEEANRLVDHRHYLILRDALEYRRIKAKNAASAKTDTTRPVLRGGKPSGTGDAAQQAKDAARARLANKRSLTLAEATALID